MPSSSMRVGECNPAAFQVMYRFRMAVKLQLIKGRCLFQQLRCDCRCQLLFEMRYRFAERQIEEELGKADEITAAATTVAIEEVLRWIDIEGGTRFLV